MEPKKNPGVDLENKRGIFFLAGLAIAILSVVGVIQIRSQISIPEPDDDDTAGVIEWEMPATVWEKKKEQVPKKLEKPKEIKNIFEPVKVLEIFMDPDIFKDNKLENDDPLTKEIGQTMEDDVPVEWVNLQNIAVPLDCEGAATREEKVACMNSWVMKYIQQNTEYPAISSRLGEEDKVYVSFVVSTTGEIEDVQVERGRFKSLNEAAVEVVRGMPAWKPARQFAKNVRMRMTIPVNFKQQ